MSAVTGYQHSAYAEALAEFGRPTNLPACNGWILVRSIDQSPWCDARGCYPIFACGNWSGLPRDLDHLQEVVSLVLVTDPFGNYTSTELAAWFPDLCREYKRHYIVDLKQPLFEQLSVHHTRNMRKAVNDVAVEACAEPARFSNEWINLYRGLIARHGVRGIAAFSRSSFEKQLQVPGINLFRALAGDETVGMMLWYCQDEVAYYHLAAYSERGYQLKASFALMARAIEQFSRQMRFLNLGGGAGVESAAADDGLTRFKKGWATDTRTAYLCGRIFDRARYDELVRERKVGPGDYFPLYRKGDVS